MAFDPDKYLAEKARVPPVGFDPDKYLAEKGGQKPEADGWFGPGGSVPRYLEESPNARELVQGTLDLLPAGGAIAGGLIGGGAGFFGGGPVGSAIGSVSGAGLGGGMGKSAQQPLEHALLGKARTAEEQLFEPVAAVKEGAFAQILGESAPTALKAIGTGAGYLGKKAMSTALGPSVESITARLARPEAIRNAKSVEQIKDLLDESMSGLFKAVDEGKIAKEEAKDALKAIEQDIRAASQDGAFQFRIKQADINDALKEAQGRLDRSFGVEKEKLTSIRSPIQMSDDVLASIQDLKAQVGKGSQESYEILGRDTNAYGVRGAAKILRDMAEEMNIKPYTANDMSPAGSGMLAKRTNFSSPEGQASRPVTSQSIGVQNELRQFANLLEQTPEAVPAKELKKILQQLDNSEKAMYGQPGFDSRVSSAYKLVRGTIDDAIKTQNPEYRAKMEEVAGKTGLLSKSLDRFNDPRSTVSRLNAIASRTSGADQELLESLGVATGRDFRAPIDQFVEAQATLKDPAKLEAIKRSLPEWKDVRLQELAKAEAARPEAAPEFIQGLISGRGLSARKSAAEGLVSGADETLQMAEKELEPFSTFTKEGTQNAITGLMKKPGAENIELRRKMSEFGNKTGKDFIQMIDDRRFANAFEGEFRAGSRNVNLGAAVGGGAGSLLLGAPGAAGGAMIGGSAGALVDKFGPQIAGKIIDGLTKVTGPIGAKNIQSLDIPSSAKSYLMEALLQVDSARDQSKGLLKKTGTK